MEPADWTDVLGKLESRDVDTCIAAAARLHAEATAEDIPRLLSLVRAAGHFFVREAAAWPLAELAGPEVLPELFHAYQRGFDEGHDNDGFTAALLEIPALFPGKTPQVLIEIVKNSEGKLRENAEWLLTFCEHRRADA